MTHYVWDTKKNVINIKKHEISFKEATEVFLEPLVFIAENRTFEGEEMIRIISARKLDRKEKKIMEAIRLGKSTKTVRRPTGRHR